LMMIVMGLIRDTVIAGEWWDWMGGISQHTLI